MKKILRIRMIFLIVLSTFLTIAPQAEAPFDYQLTTNPLGDFEHSWNPDGTRISYMAFVDSWHRHIWTMDSDGSNKIELTTGSVVTQFPAYSPDGTKIAFEMWGFRGDYMDLMIMNADGSNIQRITSNGIPGKMEGSFEEPKWSQDGTKLVFTYNEGTTGAGLPFGWWIGVVNLDGSGLEVLGLGKSPRFCCNDTKILFSTVTALSVEPPYQWNQSIALMNADGTGVQILTSGPDDVYPCMSSITNRIVFVRNFDLYVMNLDGSDLEPITSDGLNYYPEWSPDEKWISYSSKKSCNWDIWKMEAPKVKVKATVDIDPDALNLGIRGIWITCYIELPEGYNVSDTDVSTIMLNDTVPAELHPTEVGDYDGDGVPDFMVKFDEAEVISYILANINMTKLFEEKFMTITLTITGELTDGTPFQGSDTITIMLPSYGKRGTFPI